MHSHRQCLVTLHRKSHIQCTICTSMHPVEPLPVADQGNKCGSWCHIRRRESDGFHHEACHNLHRPYSQDSASLSAALSSISMATHTVQQAVMLVGLWTNMLPQQTKHTSHGHRSFTWQPFSHHHNYGQLQAHFLWTYYGSHHNMLFITIYFKAICSLSHSLTQLFSPYSRYTWVRQWFFKHLQDTAGLSSH